MKTMKKVTSINAIDFYLDYFNNYLTIGVISKQYGISYKRAYRLIEWGRYLNHKLSLKLVG